MHLSENYPVFVGEDRDKSRPRCVFSEEMLPQQSFRAFEFPDLSSSAPEEDFDELRSLAAEARREFDRELERRVGEAQRKGQELGLQEASQLHAEERAKLVDRMRGAVEAFHLALDRAEQASAQDALRLGLMVAEHLVRVVLSEDPEALAAHLVSSVSKMDSEGEIRIVAAPPMAAQLEEGTKDILSELGVQGIEVEADDNLQPGDLIIYRGAAALDARVSTQIRMIQRSLLGRLGFEALEGEP